MKLIQEWLGHSDILTKSNIYTHVDSESKKLSANAIALALDTKKQPSKDDCINVVIRCEKYHNENI